MLENKNLNEVVKYLKYYNAMKEFLLIFASEHIGQAELDIDKIAEFLCSGRFLVKMFNTEDDEEIYKLLENETLAGLPIWDFFILSDWTREILEKNFKQEVKIEFDNLKKKYKCYTCKYYHIRDTEFGILEKCKFKKRENFKIKKECINYEKGGTNQKK